MPDLTRRKFLTGAPAVVAGVAVGVAVAPTVLQAVEKPKAGNTLLTPRIMAEETERMCAYWRAAETEVIALKPRAPFYVYRNTFYGSFK